MNPGFFEQLLDAQHTAIIVLDSQLRVTFLNSSAQLLCHKSLSRAKGESVHALFRLDEQLLPSLTQLLHQLGTLSQRQIEFVALDSKRTWVDMVISSHELAGELVLVLEVQVVDRLLRISREEEVLAKQETTKHLVRGIAHEVKNPLGGIRGAAQLLESELPSAGLREYTQVIISEVDRLRLLVDRMLGSNALPNFAALNVHQVLEYVAQLLQAEQPELSIARDYDPSMPDIQGDYQALIQVVLNIGRNALQALQESATALPKITFSTRIMRQFTIGARCHRLVVKLGIADNGPGIDPALIDNVFYPMISGRASGTGLGLAIAQQIANQHGGIIECASQPGRTRFDLYLPVHQGTKVS